MGTSAVGERMSTQECAGSLLAPSCRFSSSSSAVITLQEQNVSTEPSSSSSSEIGSRRVGAVGFLVEVLAGCRRGVSVSDETALAALEVLLQYSECRAAAYAHELTVPAVVRRLVRVSGPASERAVAVLWDLCKHDPDGGVMIQALRCGAFQKLLALLQIGCSSKPKVLASQLLRLFNSYRRELEFLPSSDFRYVRSSC